MALLIALATGGFILSEMGRYRIILDYIINLFLCNKIL